MKIQLAGFNLDADVIEDLKNGKGTNLILTPETLSAAAARISRDPRPIPELRREARLDVARARERTERIVFGLGHKSVAEHAVFNFDVLDASRLAIEHIEGFRLASYTEKSQRYIRLGEDFVVPTDIDNPDLREEFRQRVLGNFDCYNALVDAIVASGQDQKLAGEDARYVCPLATTGQLEMTVNARELEHIIQELLGSPLEEVRDAASQFLKIASGVAHSLIRYVDPTEYTKSRRRFPDLELGTTKEEQEVTLVRHTAEPDVQLVTSLYQRRNWISDYETCLARVRAMSHGEMRNYVLETLEGITEHDDVPRDFEHITFTFEIITSAAAYGQWKRHRMATMDPRPYDLSLGLTIPEAVIRAGQERRLREEAATSEELYNKIKKDYGREVAEYALLNAHRRRILVTLNTREFYAVARLRDDQHAQWDIRNGTRKMLDLASEKAKLVMELACGKDRFKEVAARYFGK